MRISNNCGLAAVGESEHLHTDFLFTGLAFAVGKGYRHESLLSAKCIEVC